MNNKVLSILFCDVDKETRHYIMKRMTHPERKDWPTAKQKENKDSVDKLMAKKK